MSTKLFQETDTMEQRLRAICAALLQIVVSRGLATNEEINELVRERVDEIRKSDEKVWNDAHGMDFFDFLHTVADSKKPKEAV